MMQPLVSCRIVLVAAAAPALSIAHCASAEVIETYTQTDFEIPVEQFGFGLSIISIPEIQGTVIESRVDLEFTTGDGFDASTFSMIVLAPTENDIGEFGNTWTVTGSDMGWAGHGTFTASLSSTLLAGLIFPDPVTATWELELGPNVGTIESLTIEHDYLVAPAPAGTACVLLGAALFTRRRRSA